MVSTNLKNISQNGNLPQIGVKIKVFETTTQWKHLTTLWSHQGYNFSPVPRSKGHLPSLSAASVHVAWQTLPEMASSATNTKYICFQLAEFQIRRILPSLLQQGISQLPSSPPPQPWIGFRIQTNKLASLSQRYTKGPTSAMEWTSHLGFLCKIDFFK